MSADTSPHRRCLVVSRQRAPCPTCGEMRAVTPSGTMWWHKSDIWKGGYRQECAGVGQTPKSGENGNASG